MEMTIHDRHWFDLICQCRQSGLTDKQWCMDNNIHPSTFYRHARMLRDQSWDIPMGKHCPKSAVKQDIVPVQIIDEGTQETNSQPILAEPSAFTANTQTSQTAASNVCRRSESFKPVMRIDSSAGIVVEFTNETSPVLLSSVIKALQVLC